MAVVGPAHLNSGLESGLDSAQYDMTGSDIDAEGEDDIELDYPPTDTHMSEPADVVDPSDSLSDHGDEEDDEDEEDEDEDENVGAVKVPNGHEVESDEDAVIEDGTGESSITDDDESDKSSSEAESAAGEEWEGGSEGPEDAEGEVATRNNCM